MKKPSRPMEHKAGQTLSTARPGSNCSSLAGRVLREGKRSSRKRT